MGEGPRSIRELLVEMKNVTDRMVDISFASVYFDDEELAELVVELEKKMDEFMYDFFRVSAVVSRNPTEIKSLVGLMQVATSAESISNACGDLCAPIAKKEDVNPILKEALFLSSEKFARIEIGTESMLYRQRVGDLRLPSTWGVWILAVKRGEKYTLVDKNLVLEEGDHLILKGPLEGIKKVCKMNRAVFQKPTLSKKYAKLKRTLAQMKDMAVLSVDLAYSSVLLNLVEPAQLVRKVEEKFDSLNYRLWSEILRLARKGEKALMSLLEVVRSLERITDSADAIADIMLRGMKVHPILAEALRETEESIGVVRVEQGSMMENQTIEELDLWNTTGTYILFIMRGDDILYFPKRNLKIQAGDQLVIRGQPAGIEKTRWLAQRICSSA